MERNVQLRRELLAEVEAVAPTLAAHAADSEGLARLNPPSIEALRKTRLLRFICPKERGGDEADPITHLEIIEALAKIGRGRHHSSQSFLACGNSQFRLCGLPRTHGRAPSLQR